MAKLLIDVDHGAFLGAGADSMAVAAAVESVVNTSSLRYEHQFHVTHRLTIIAVRASLSQDPYGPLCAPPNPCLAAALHDKLVQEWPRGPACSGDDHVAAQVFANLPTSVDGLAPIGGLGNPARLGGYVRAGLVLTDRFTGLHAHELAHTWDAFDCVNCGLMNPSEPEITDRFLGGSISEIEAMRDTAVNAGCIDPFVDLVFADQFESGDTSTWSAEDDPADQLTVLSGDHAIEGSWSLGIDVQSANYAWLRTDAPAGERRLRAHFLVDVRKFSAQGVEPITLLQASTGIDVAFRVRLRRAVIEAIGTYYWLDAAVTLDGGIEVVTGSALISGSGTPGPGPLPVPVEIDWRAASAAGADDGHLRLWTGSTEVDALTGLDNDQRTVDMVFFGAVDGTGYPGTSGLLLLDAFELHREQPVVAGR